MTYRSMLSHYFTDVGNVFYLVAIAALGTALAHVPGLSIAYLTLIACGMVLYVPQEYLAHVFVFHMKAPRNPLLYRLLYRIHHGHHDEPERADILFTPLWFTLPILAFNMTLFFLLTSSLAATLALTTGLVAGYLVFEWLHLYMHTSIEPRLEIFRTIKHRHMGHHHRSENHWFIITPLGIVCDEWFGTGGDVHAQRITGTAATLGVPAADPRKILARTYYASGYRRI